MSDHQQNSTEGDANCNCALQLRLHASNLPRFGLLKALPSAFVTVTSISNSSQNNQSQSSLNNNSNNKKDNTQGNKTVEWGETEIIHNNSNPQWTTTFDLDYVYGSESFFHVQVFRFVSANDKPVSLGSAVYEVGDILGTHTNTKVKRLPKGGALFCRLEPIQDKIIDSIFRFQFSASDINVGGRLSKFTANHFNKNPDTRFEIAKRQTNNDRNGWMTIYRSKPVFDSVTPTYDIGEVDLHSICNGDITRPIRISISLYRARGKDMPVAVCETTIKDILNTQQRDFNANEIEAENTQHGFRLQRSESKIKFVGRLKVNHAEIVGADNLQQDMMMDMNSSLANIKGVDDDPYAIDLASLPSPIAAPATFQEYVDAGCTLDFTVAIDFTSSNDDPRVPGTLHDQTEDNLNDYQETITAIGNAVAVYSNAFSVYGFGAKFAGVVRHIFQCGPTPTVQGVEGILNAYQSVFSSDLTMSGPTIFDQIIQATAVKAKKLQQSDRMAYCVLLIITDGIAENLEETKRKLGVYSSVPLSVIFVGLGRADFKSMYALCNSDGSSRPNATFVEYRQHQHDPRSLGKAALCNLPGQCVQYFLQAGINPQTNRIR